ncbi:helix-turn-helix transcriptional regulator [Mycolicibacterium mengxianglii]|uniref:helix-turn-helix transcriptional regulator n=1 Tax=Mycolicibacterium mengxianglii TaxID=2736649 RepID=UPI0018EF21B5|nr:helix-turn-helix transcriptional regulator [Mycolicibacterium mengxianglii]
MLLPPDIGPLGQFLRTHRDRRAPEETEISRGNLRRVPGLRREEVAVRAGISVEYYIRLEQGRERSPSVTVCDGLARALSLDRDETSHLYQLAGLQRSCSDPSPFGSRVPAGSQILIETLGLPAIIQNRYTDVLASNALARALSPNLSPGVNIIRALFLDPRERQLVVDWDRAAANCVAQLRLSIGSDLTASPARDLTSELMKSSVAFRQLWSQHDVEPAPVSPVRFRHPDVGQMEVFREKLVIAGASDLSMMVFHTRPNTPSWSALERLRAIVAGYRADSTA